MTEVRATTLSLCGCRRPSTEIISSVMPSLRYSCSGSALKLRNGSTARRNAPDGTSSARDGVPSQLRATTAPTRDSNRERSAAAAASAAGLPCAAIEPRAPRLDAAIRQAWIGSLTFLTRCGPIDS